MHKSGLFAVAVGMFVATTGLAFAQSGTEGPLAAPGETPHPAAKAAKKVKHKKLAHHDGSRASDASTPPEAPAPHRDIALPSSGAAADPMSFGMKWNGNSDNARETRIQNYNGDATGSGAEVGMKLHF